MPLRASLLPQSNSLGFTPHGEYQSLDDLFFAHSIPKKPRAILLCDSDERFFRATDRLCQEMGIPLYRCQATEQLQQTLTRENPACIWLAGSSLAMEQSLRLCASKNSNTWAIVLLLNPGQKITIEFSLPTKASLHVIEKPRLSEKITDLLQRTYVVHEKQRNAEQHLTLHYQTIHQLPSAEREVLLAICNGVLNKQMAKQLGVSIRTIEQRRRRLFQLLGVSSAGPLGYRAGLAEAFRKMTGRRR